MCTFTQSHDEVQTGSHHEYAPDTRGPVNHQPPPYAHHLLSVCDVCDHHLLCPYQRPSCHTQKQVRVLLRGVDQSLRYATTQFRTSAIF